MNQVLDISKYGNLGIIGNTFVFNEEGTIVDLSVNVNAVGKSLILNNDSVGGRRNFLLLGDITHDLNMVKNIDYDNLIAIGFLNKPSDPVRAASISNDRRTSRRPRKRSRSTSLTTVSGTILSSSTMAGSARS